jgi:uncharacterized protein YecE (DUF72 family)
MAGSDPDVADPDVATGAGAASVGALGTPIRIGTCSWADESLTKHWYPSGVRSAEERLRYYADRFDTVEVNSTYYRLPEEETVARWAERLPEGFVMHVKAFGVMTRHPVKADALPADLREQAPVDERGRVERPPREFRAEVFARFHAALEPLRQVGKLGGILLQFPPYVVCKDLSFDYLTWAVEELRGDRALVEFRHRSWLDDENRARVLSFLEDLGATHVVVDAPKTKAKNLVPTVVATTSPIAYVRMHGRNAKTWNVRGGSAAERFDYLYPQDELREWVEPLRQLRGQAEEAYVMFNTNNWSRRRGADKPAAQAPANAALLRSLLDDEGVPATGAVDV